jgi:predicted nucleic acid-binding protein
MALTAFFDTSVLLAGLIDFGPQSAPAQRMLHAVVDGSAARPATAWHCCLEFFSVSTRLPPEFRLQPADAARLLDEVVFPHFEIRDLPATDRGAFFARAVQDDTAGGRIYDAHIADVARSAGATVIVTDNRRHFVAALRHGIRVETPSEFLASSRSLKR